MKKTRVALVLPPLDTDVNHFFTYHGNMVPVVGLEIIKDFAFVEITANKGRKKQSDDKTAVTQCATSCKRTGMIRPSPMY